MQFISIVSSKGQFESPIYFIVDVSPLGNKLLNPITCKLYIFSIITFVNLWNPSKFNSCKSKAFLKVRLLQ